MAKTIVAATVQAGTIIVEVCPDQVAGVCQTVLDWTEGAKGTPEYKEHRAKPAHTFYSFPAGAKDVDVLTAVFGNSVPAAVVPTLVGKTGLV